MLTHHLDHLPGMAAVFALGACANLAWVEPKLYTPQSTEIFVEQLGIDGPVDILPVGTTQVAIAHQITNTGSRAVAAGYEITETVVQWVFRRNPTDVGWYEGDRATHTIVALSQSGPALQPGQSATITFGPFPVPDCGLFGETLHVDAANVVPENADADNLDKHLFFVPSRQRLNIALTTFDDTLLHDAGKVRTHRFEISSSGGTPNQWLYTYFVVNTSEDSTAETVPAPAPRTVQGPAKQVIDMFVDTKSHPLPNRVFEPILTGKVTAIATDGCVIRQKAAQVFIDHS